MTKTTIEGDMISALYCCDEYMVDSAGYVLSKRGNKPLKPSINHSGYAVINLMIGGERIGMSVHSAVANTFMPGKYKEGLQVNHKDGDRLNNSVENLECVTPAENMRHSIDVLHHRMGGQNGQARAIKGIDKDGNIVAKYPSIMDCAREYALEEQNPRNIQNVSWKALRGYKKTYRGLYWEYDDET